MLDNISLPTFDSIVISIKGYILVVAIPTLMLSGLSALVRALETISAIVVITIDPFAQLGFVLIIYVFSCAKLSLNG